MTDIWQQRQDAWQDREQALDKIDTLTPSKRDDKEVAWAKASEKYLQTNTYCDECDKRGYMVPAEYVGHIRNPKNSQALFWDMNNWQALCTTCHRRLIGTAPLKIPNPILESANLYVVK